MRSITWCSTLLLALAAGCGDSTDKKPTTTPKKPPAEGVLLKTLDFDQTLALIKSHQGKVVIVDCWSTL